MVKTWDLVLILEINTKICQYQSKPFKSFEKYWPVLTSIDGYWWILKSIDKKLRESKIALKIWKIGNKKNGFFSIFCKSTYFLVLLSELVNTSLKNWEWIVNINIFTNTKQELLVADSKTVVKHWHAGACKINRNLFK